MTARTPAYLKGRFEQNDIPQGVDYEDVFDSYLNVVVSSEQSIDSNLRTTKKFISATVSADRVTTSAASFNTVSALTLAANNANISVVSAGDVNVSGRFILGTLDVSALATTQAGALTLTATNSFVIFADGANNAVKLPTSERGRQQTIINAASTTIKIFPATSGRFLVTAVNASLNIPADKTALVYHKGDDRYGIVIGGF